MARLRSKLVILLELLAGFASKTLLQTAKSLGKHGTQTSLLAKAHADGGEGKKAIVITTFARRFMDDCLPLIRDLRSADIHEPIYLVLNGDANGVYDSELRSKFLSEVTKFKDVNPICFGTQRGVAAMWNAGIRYSDADFCLVLNDDLVVDKTSVRATVDALFSELGDTGLVTISNSFGHFGVSRDCIRSVGWFDERFLGFGEEDGDFIWRFESHFGRKLGNVNSFGLINEASDAGYEKIVSGKGKYSLFNNIYLKQKYKFGAGSINGPFGDSAEKLLNEQGPFETDRFRDEAIGLLLEENEEKISSSLRSLLGPIT
jgi:hypothetical protein